MRRLFFALFLVACTATDAAPPVAVPDWDAIPAGISSALCARLQMDAIGSSGAYIDIVTTTQPIVTPQALAALGKPKRNRKVTIVHRALPVGVAQTNTGGCSWKPVTAIDPQNQYDEMVVELSAPVGDPTKNGAGIIARVSLGGAHAAWYWIDLVPRGENWFVGRIFPLPL